MSAPPYPEPNMSPKGNKFQNRQVRLSQKSPLPTRPPGGAHGATDDLVEVIGGLVLPIDLGIGGKRHARPHELDRAGLVGGTRERRTRLRYGLLEETIPDCGLRQHGSRPPVDGAIGSRCARARKFR